MLQYKEIYMTTIMTSLLKKKVSIPKNSLSTRGKSLIILKIERSPNTKATVVRRFGTSEKIFLFDIILFYSKTFSLFFLVKSIVSPAITSSPALISVI